MVRVGRALIVIESPRDLGSEPALVFVTFQEFPGSLCTGHVSMELGWYEEFPVTLVGRDYPLLSEGSILVLVFTTGFIGTMLKFQIVAIQW